MSLVGLSCLLVSSDGGAISLASLRASTQPLQRSSDLTQAKVPNGCKGRPSFRLPFTSFHSINTFFWPLCLFPPPSLFRFLLNIWKDSRQVRGNGSHSLISPQSLLCISKTSWSGPDESSRPRQRAIIRWPGLPRYAHVHIECIKCLCVNGSVCVHVFLLSYNLVYSVHVYVCVCVCVCVLWIYYLWELETFTLVALWLYICNMCLFLLLFVLFFASDANCVCVLSSCFFATIRLAFTRVYHCQASCFVCCRCQPCYFAFVMEQYGIQRERERERALLHLFPLWKLFLLKFNYSKKQTQSIRLEDIHTQLLVHTHTHTHTHTHCISLSSSLHLKNQFLHQPIKCQEVKIFEPTLLDDCILYSENKIAFID